jgi:hypothetical protein
VIPPNCFRIHILNCPFIACGDYLDLLGHAHKYTPESNSAFNSAHILLYWMLKFWAVQKKQRTMDLFSTLASTRSGIKSSTHPRERDSLRILAPNQLLSSPVILHNSWWLLSLMQLNAWRPAQPPIADTFSSIRLSNLLLNVVHIIVALWTSRISFPQSQPAFALDSLLKHQQILSQHDTYWVLSPLFS